MQWVSFLFVCRYRVVLYYIYSTWRSVTPHEGNKNHGNSHQTLTITDISDESLPTMAFNVQPGNWQDSSSVIISHFNYKKRTIPSYKRYECTRRYKNLRATQVHTHESFDWHVVTWHKIITELTWNETNKYFIRNKLLIYKKNIFDSYGLNIGRPSYPIFELE